MPSMRGMEKPHTSASKTATWRSLRARATARLAERDDLPTPPLPDAISRQRVLLAGSLKGSVSVSVLSLSVGSYLRVLVSSLFSKASFGGWL